MMKQYEVGTTIPTSVTEKVGHPSCIITPVFPVLSLLLVSQLESPPDLVAYSSPHSCKISIPGGLVFIVFPIQQDH